MNLLGLPSASVEDICPGSRVSVPPFRVSPEVQTREPHRRCLFGLYLMGRKIRCRLWDRPPRRRVGPLRNDYK